MEEDAAHQLTIHLANMRHRYWERRYRSGLDLWFLAEISSRSAMTAPRYHKIPLHTLMLIDIEPFRTGIQAFIVNYRSLSRALRYKRRTEIASLTDSRTLRLDYDKQSLWRASILGSRFSGLGPWPLPFSLHRPTPPGFCG